MEMSFLTGFVQETNNKIVIREDKTTK